MADVIHIPETHKVIVPLGNSLITIHNVPDSLGNILANSLRFPQQFRATAPGVTDGMDKPLESASNESSNA